MDILVLSMYTDNYAEKAARLRASCERFGLAHQLRRVPSVHDSISKFGTPDASYTKAAIILDALDRHRGPVLWIDADCEICAPPRLIGELLADGTEFAIYNWAADRQTEAYIPVRIVTKGEGGAPGSPKRFFRYVSKLDYYDPAQLMCSGAVQLYAATAGARLLLETWQSTILRFRGAADDHCMDYAWNNRPAALAGLRAAWLPKAYARYGWWPYVEPVINHEEFAHKGTHFVPIPEAGGVKQFYPERAERLHEPLLFPADCIIDTEQRRLLRIENKTITLDQPIEQEFWT